MKNPISIYGDAPELLLDKLSEVNIALSKHSKTKAYDFWRSVSEIMRMSYNYMNDVQFIWKENQMLRSENKFLKEWAMSLNERLQVYETIRKEMMNGNLDEKINIVREVVNGKE